jgi:hypothetical protein
MPNIPQQGLALYYQAANGISSLTSGEWYVNTEKKHAFKVASDFDTVLDGRLIPEQAKPAFEIITGFSEAAVTAAGVERSRIPGAESDASEFPTWTTELDNTQIVRNPDGTEQIELELPERILTLLMDQSGSMSWNDSEGLRHTVSRRLVERVNATYPGIVNYNLVQFGGEPVNVTLFGTLDNVTLDGSDVQTVTASFFEDEENNFAGIRVVRKEGSYPTSPLDGEIVQEGYFTRSVDIELIEGTTYYYTIFTFDKNSHFSDGVQISAVPQERNIPRGVSRVSNFVVLGSGVIRDDNTIGLWHFDEEKENLAYDFSDNKNNLIIDDSPVWLHKDEVPSGLSGIRAPVDGTASVAYSSGASSELTLSDQMTLMAWIYPYDNTYSGGIVGRFEGASTDFALFTDGNGALSFTANGAALVSTPDNTLNETEWNHVAAVIDGTTVTFYVNGELINSGTFSTVGHVSDDIAQRFRVGYYDGLGSSYFFGKYTEVSVHNIARDATYIAGYAVVQDLEENPNNVVTSSTTTNTISTDNGDRLSVINYDVPSDFDFETIEFIRNETKTPSWEEDGSLIESVSASQGSFVFTDADDFVIDNTYYYRIMTKNSLGNYSYQSDSPVISVNITSFPDTENIDSLSPELFAPQNVATQEGNAKIYLTWQNPAIDDRVKRVEIYYSDDKFPVIEEGTIGSEELLFRGLIGDEKYVHRDLENGKPAYYTLIMRDKYGRASSPINISDTPSLSADDTGIPLLDIENLFYEIVDNETLSLSWEVPIDFKSNINGFLDQRVVIYAAVTDQFGAPVSSDTAISMEVSPQITRRDLVEDVFGGIGASNDTYDDEDLYTFSVIQESPGVVKGTLSMIRDAEVLSLIEKGDFSIKVTSTIPDPADANKNLFAYSSAPIVATLINPWSVELTNRDNRMVKRKCPVSLEGLDFSSLLQDTDMAYEEKSFDGVYVRSSTPFVVRVNLAYRNEPLDLSSSIRVSVYDADDNVCSEDFSPNAIRQSTTVLPLSTTLNVQTELIEELSELGDPTGEFVEKSFVDVPIDIPNLPQGAILFVEAEYGGYISRQSFFFLLENILQIELTARAPIADNTDIAEQQASVWLVDPDDITSRLPVPDLTVVRWTLIKKEYGRDRPFYSTDSVPGGSGILSYVRNGLAHDVYFGPASGVIWHYKFDEESGAIKVIGERYEVFASVVYDGLSARDDNLLEIFPLGARNRFGSRLLMEFPEFKNILWADGEDYEKLIISRDASNPSPFSRFDSCFQTCALDEGADLIELNPGQIINITTNNDFEIIWGDVTESTDPYTGRSVLILGRDAKTSTNGQALVEIEDDDETYVYFRINKFFPPVEHEDSGGPLASLMASFLNPCECLDIKEDVPIFPDQPEESTVAGSTNILLNELPRILRGGGDMSDGVPPTILVPQEPLKINVVDKRVDGVPSETFVIDGEAINSVVLEVDFAAQTVPDGTPITIQIASELEGGVSKISLESRTIYTTTSIDDNIDSVNARSYAIAKFDPITKDDGVFEQVIFTTTYDKSGETAREKQVCVTVDWQPDIDSGLRNDDVLDMFNEQLYAYNIGANTWDSTLAPMNHPRGYPLINSNRNLFYDTVMANGPTAYWRMGESTGATVMIDEMGNNSGTYVGGPTFGQTGILGHDWDTSVSFALAPIEYATVPMSSDLQVVSAFTFFAFVKGVPPGSILFENGETTYSFRISGTVTGSIDVILRGVVGPDVKFYQTSVAGFDGAWHSIAFTWGPGSNPLTNDLKIYIDGIEDTAIIKFPGLDDNFTVASTAVGPLIFGENGFASPAFTTDEVCVFQKTLTAAQILEMHNNAAVTGKIYATSGIDKSTISQINEEYDLETDVWTDKAIMPTGRFGAQSVMVGSKIYVLGGITTDEAGINLEVSRAVEAYDIDEDEWDILEDMPNISDGTALGTNYGIAFGVAKHIRVSGEDRIYVLCGLRAIKPDGSIDTYNDLVLYYSIDTDSWTAASDLLTGVDFEVYKRISPNVFIDGSNIVVTGGSFVEGDEASSRMIYVSDTFSFNTSTGAISSNDNEFSNIPTPRFRAASDSVDTDHYFLGGSNDQSQNLDTFETSDSSSSPWDTSALTDMPSPNTGSDMAVATSTSTSYSNDPFIFTTGGFKSGRSEGFLQIKTIIAPEKVKLDGRQSAAIAVELLDQNGDPPATEVNIVIRGFIKFGEGTQVTDTQEIANQNVEQQTEASQRNAANSTDDRFAIYPVLFTSNEITTSGGKATVTLLPRAEDILEEVEDIAERSGTSIEDVQEQSGESTFETEAAKDASIVINAGEERQPYSVLVQITVVDDFYYGQTIENLAEFAGGEEAVDAASVDTDTTSTTDTQSITSSSAGSELCKNGPTITGSLSWEGFSRGLDFGGTSLRSAIEGISDEETNTFFSLIPSALGQLDSPIFPYFNDIDWIPAIESILEDSDSTATQMLSKLRNLRNSVPFGASALFDALAVAAGFLSDNDLDGIGKVIYVFTDNENNMSSTTIDEAIEELNGIDGAGSVPSVIGNFAVVSPATLSAKANVTDTNDLNKLIADTAGQAISVLSEDFVDDIVGIFVGEAVGSLGYGQATITVDLGTDSNINRLSALFQLYENTNGRWSIEISQDGFTWVDIAESYRANVDVDFTNMSARYIKFTVTLITGFSASNLPEYELIPLPGSPALTALELFYDTSKIRYLYLNTESTDVEAQQVAVAVDASDINPEDIQVGISKSESSNWLDFSNPAQISINQNGKIFIPIRFPDDDDAVEEPLIKVDKFSYRTHFGRWDPKSTIEIIDSDGDTVLDSTYSTHSRDGLIVFNQVMTGSYTIRIRNQSIFRVGLKLISRSDSDPLEIHGVGYMYNRNAHLLPPAEKLPPIAKNILITPDEPEPYSVIQASYEYSDSNNDPEDTEQRKIRWHINGVRIPYLDDLVKWNDVTNSSDPIWSHAFTFSPSEVGDNTTAISKARKKGQSILSPDDRLWFTIRVHDGLQQSEIFQSNATIVSESSPEVESVAVRGLLDNKISNKVTAAHDAIVQFNMLADTSVNNSVIIWFVNGEQFKSGVFGRDEDADRILSGELSNIAEIALSMTNEIFVRVLPNTDASTGTAVDSDTIIVENAIPSVNSVTVGPSNPSSSQSLVLSYIFFDADIVAEGEGTQSDLSTVVWQKAARDNNYQFTRVAELDNQSIVNSTYTTRSERWRAIVTPFDGLENGTPVTSNTVTIG